MELKMILDGQKCKYRPIVRVLAGVEIDIDEEELRNSREKNRALIEYCEKMEE